MKIAIIAAAAENGTIGFTGKIPWHLPADFKWFRDLTKGHPIIEGRKTFESIGKPLPGRTNIVITRDPGYRAEGCLVAGSLDAALEMAGKTDGGGADGVAFICGGEQIYRGALPIADTIYLTRVHGTFQGDAFFPEFDENEWQLVRSEDHPKDAENSLDFTWLTYKRKK
jgi:dihydrofolate reductase